MHPVLLILKEGESTWEEREVTNILQSQESHLGEGEDSSARQHKDKGKDGAPFEYYSIVHISPVSSMPSMRRSEPPSPPGPNPNPDPTPSGSENEDAHSWQSSHHSQFSLGIPDEMSSPPCPPPPSPPPPSNPLNRGSDDEEDNSN